MDAEPVWKPEFIDLNELEGAFDFEEGFSRPNWPLISKTVRERTARDDWDRAFTEAARQWVMQIQSDLGGEYAVSESRRFLLLSELETDSRRGILAHAEQTRDSIRECLGDAAWSPNCGKHVIILFSEEDDYYQYLSYFHKDGIHPASGGCLIRKRYVHIAAPYQPRGCRTMLAHELAHNLVVHLPLPLWLNEGLAVTFQRGNGARGQPLLADPDLQPRHIDYWNEKTIQEFWAGVSFHKPGDSNELSYSLAEILLTLLLEKRWDFPAFLKQANWRDAGQTAAMNFLGVDLGAVAGTFLGKGDWRPRRKAMVELWEAAKQPPKEEESGDSEAPKT